MNPLFLLGTVCVLAMCSAAAESAAPLPPRLTIKAVKHNYRNAPIFVTLPDEIASKYRDTDALFLDDGSGQFVACQYVAGSAQLQTSASLVFILPELKQGKERTFTLKKGKIGRPVVRIELATNAVDVRIDNRLFTRYITDPEAKKPYFFPILNPDGSHYTRRFPLDKTSTESDDHLHHKGLWFTHGDVNGSDFWMEESNGAKTVTKTVKMITPVGYVFGEFRATTDWVSKEGKVLATDTRQIKIVPLPNGNCLLDFRITIKPVGNPVTLGDTKEGTFALRVAETLAPKPDASANIKTPTAKMINNNGEMGGEAWGKKASWVDYSGQLGNAPYGIAMFDAPDNLRHPTTWHAREYGLFAVNPFGLHDFKLGDKGAGNHVIAMGESLTLHYAVFFHKGDTIAADVAGQYTAFAEPPQMRIR